MVQTRRERLREATAEEIKSVALHQMNQQGAVALSLRAVAAEMGMTAPALYRYFKSRDELITALIAGAYNSLGAALQTASNRHPPEAYAARFLAAVLAYREWSLAHRVEFGLIFGTPIPDYHAPAEITSTAVRRAFYPLVSLLLGAWQSGQLVLPQEYTALPPALLQQLGQWGQAEGLTINPAIQHLAFAGWGQIHGLVALEVFGHFQFLAGDPGEIYRFEIQSYLRRLGMSL